MNTAAVQLLYRCTFGLYLTAWIMGLVGWWTDRVRLARVSSGVLFAGILLHGVSLVAPASWGGFLGLDTPFRITSAYVFATLLGSYMVALRARFRSSLVLLFSFPLVIALASLTVDPEFQPFRDSIHLPGIQVHLVLLVLAYASFSVSGALGALLVTKARLLKAKRPGGIAAHLPPLMVLDRLTATLLSFGFVTYLFSILVAFLFPPKGPGGPPLVKITLSFLLLGVYASILWGRLRKHWSGYTLGISSLLACGIAFLVFLGTQYLGRGLR